MKTAKEMFEALGYGLVRNDEKYITYVDVLNEDLYISFSKEYKVVSGTPTYDYFLNMSILKAINKQCEELGWLDE